MTFGEAPTVFRLARVLNDDADKRALKDAKTMCGKLVVGADGDWLREACKDLRLMRTTPNKLTLIEFDDNRSICFFSKTPQHNLLGAGAEEHYQRFEFRLGDKVIKLDALNGRRRYRVERHDGNSIVIALDRDGEVHLVSQAGMRTDSPTGRATATRTRVHGPLRGHGR